MRTTITLLLFLTISTANTKNYKICEDSRNIAFNLKETISSFIDKSCSKDKECAPDNDPIECSDLYSIITDDSKVFNDGTGYSYPKSKYEEIKSDVAKVEHEKATKRIKAFLKSDDGEYLLNTHLKKAFKTTDTQKIAPILANYTLWRVSGTPPFRRIPQYQGHDAMSIDATIGNSKFNKSVVKPMADGFEEKFKSNKMKNEIEELFHEVKAEVIKKIENKWDIKDDKVKKAMISKIKNISFNGVDCKGLSSGPEDGVPNMSGLIAANAYYNLLENSVSICNGLFLNNTSKFSHAFFLAHEIGHAIDPCFIAFGGINYSSLNDVKQGNKDFPVNGLISCLRNKNGIGAKRIAPINKKVKVGEIEKDSFVKSPFCSRSNAMETITEASADWVAGEITPEIAKKFEAKWRSESISEKEIKRRMRAGYSSIGHGSVFSKRSQKELDFLSKPNERLLYPPDHKRVLNIMLNPDIRTQMGCQSEPKDNMCYCRRDK